MLQIGWIGVGNMGEAILRGALQGSALTVEQVHLFDANILKTNKLQEELHVHVAGSTAELISVSDMVLLAVKPHVCSVVLAEHREMLQDKALISIAAGWSQERLASLLPERVRILRVMPNTPAMVGEGMTVFEQGNTLSREEYEFALQLFSAVGRVSEAESQQMDAVTGVSGSGPAYVYVFIEALADAGVRAGLPRSKAYELAAQTVLGSARMVLETAEHPGRLKDNVCSPAGTTIEAVAALERCGFRNAILEAVDACVTKSKSIGK